MKLIKKITNILLVMILLFSEFAPYMVFAATERPTTALAGQIYNPQTGEISNSSVSVIENYDTGLSNDQGDISIRKTITKVAGSEGYYTVSFDIIGNQVDSPAVPKPVYAVVVLDKSGSMDETNKWSSATKGAVDFAETLLDKISNANIALVTFSGSRDDEYCIDYEWNGWYNECVAYDTYNDATVVRDFENKDFSNVKFPKTPSGGTN